MSKGFGERMGDFFRDVQSERDRYREAAARAAAELANFKREAQRQAEERERLGAERVMRALLPAMEHLDRALDYGQGEVDPEAMLEGVRLIRQEIANSLESVGLTRVEPARGQGFDPSVMEVVEVREDGGMEPGLVMGVISAGYTFRGKVLAPARVIVSGKDKEKRQGEEEA